MGEIISFIMRQQDGTIIQPWRDVPHLRNFEWVKDAESAVSGNDRIIASATYIDITQELIPEAFVGELPYDSDKETHYWVAHFSDDSDGRRYSIAKRLIPRELEQGDKVTLTILGCCSITSVSGLEWKTSESINPSELSTQKTEDLTITTSDTKSSKNKMSSTSSTATTKKSKAKKTTAAVGKKGSKAKTKTKKKGSY